MSWILALTLSILTPCEPKAPSPAAAIESPWTLDCQDDHRLQELWSGLLECSILQTPVCRKLLERVASDCSSVPHQELASVLLKEWGLDASNPLLARARRIWVPLPTLDELQRLVPQDVEPAVLVVSGIVRPDGRIEDLQFLRDSENEDLNRAILDAFAKGRYRPARDGKQFVSQRVEFLYRLHPE